MRERRRWPTLTVIAAVVIGGVVTGSFRASAQGDDATESQYAVKCAACHTSGLLGAPRLGAADDWKPRLEQGRDALVDHAIKGFKQMPPRGGNPSLTDDEVSRLVDYMIAKAKGTGDATAAASGPTAAPAVKVTPKPKMVAAPKTRPSGANAFNRLMKPPKDRNPPPSRDGIHDPASAGTELLQPPLDAFSNLPKATSGNRVDWVAALKHGKIAPRYDRTDASVEPVILDLNIVREVKGSMPDVVYPHAQHTQWLDCSNCHPAIFAPQKGANQMSMAGILLGKQCGVCHGKVAFPVSDCRRCHSGKKGKVAGQ